MSKQAADHPQDGEAYNDGLSSSSAAKKSSKLAPSTFNPRRHSNSIYQYRMKSDEYIDDVSTDTTGNPIQDQIEIIKLIMLNFSDKCKRFYFKIQVQ